MIVAAGNEMRRDEMGGYGYLGFWLDGLRLWGRVRDLQRDSTVFFFFIYPRSLVDVVIAATSPAR